MSKLSIIKELNNLNFKDISSSIKKIESLESSQDVLYHANLIIFQSSTINHKERLSFLKKTNNLSIKYKLPFCNAHSMTLLIKVCRELGIQKKIIEDSHYAIKLWKSILGEPLAVNGLIFTYIDLGLIYSDYNLNMLGLEYLNKAESLLSECDNEYYPFSKLYVAYAILLYKIAYAT